MNFWRGDGGGDAKQESGDFCGWVGEILTPNILLKDRLIGDKGREEFLEEEKEGVSFSSPEIPRGGIEEEIFQKKNFLPLLKGGGQEGKGVLWKKSSLNLLGGKGHLTQRQCCAE